MAGGDAPLRPWILSYEISDAAWEPFPWCLVSLHGRDGGEFAKREGGSRGALEVLDGAYLVVRAHRRVHWPVWRSEWLEAPPGGTRHLVVRMPELRTVSGTALEQDGETPVSGAHVSASWAAADGSWTPPDAWASATTDAAGRFVVEGLPPGRVRVEVGARSFTQGSPAGIDAEAGDEDLRIVLGPQGAVALLVTDEATGLAPRTKHLRIDLVTKDGEQVWKHWTRTTLGEPRAAEWTAWHPVSPGASARFRVRAVGYEPSPELQVVVPPTGGRHLLRVPLRPAPEQVARLRVRVHLPDVEPPARILVRRDVGSNRTTTAEALIDGTFVLDLLPGAHRLDVGRAAKPESNYAYSFLVPVELRLDLAPGETRDVEVTLEMGGWVVFRDLPSPSYDVYRLTSGARVLELSPGFELSAEEGKMVSVLGPVPAGTWTLEGIEGGIGRRTQLSVEPGQVTRLDPATFEAFTVEER
jgi:hypothetical protein